MKNIATPTFDKETLITTDIRVVRAAHKAIKELDAVVIYDKSIADKEDYYNVRNWLYNIIKRNGYEIRMNDYKLMKVKK